jgi:hypothetical protein
MYAAFTGHDDFKTYVEFDMSQLANVPSIMRALQDREIAGFTKNDATDALFPPNEPGVEIGPEGSTYSTQLAVLSDGTKGIQINPGYVTEWEAKDTDCYYYNAGGKRVYRVGVQLLLGLIHWKLGKRFEAGDKRITVASIGPAWKKFLLSVYRTTFGFPF